MDPSRGPKGPIQGHDSGKEGRACRCLALWVLEPRALWSPGSEHQRSDSSDDQGLETSR